MTTALHKVIALEKGVRSQTDDAIAGARQKVGKADLFAGLSRNYAPLHDDVTGANELPPETRRVQLRVPDILADVQAALARLLDVTATKAVGNAVAKADIVVDGVTLVRDVPATWLLDLEKRLVDLRSFVSRLPTLDPAEKWSDEPDAAWEAYATEAAVTVRTKKVPRNHVVAEATDKHPAQVQVYTEDVPEGRWSTVKYSGAVPARQVTAMLARLSKLAEATQEARETANRQEVEHVTPGAAILGYVFGGNLTDAPRAGGTSAS